MWQVVSDLHKLSTELALADLKSRAPTAEATAFKLPGGEGGGNYASFDLDDGADGGEYGAIQAAGNAARALLVWGSLGRGLAVGLANHTCGTQPTTMPPSTWTTWVQRCPTQPRLRHLGLVRISCARWCRALAPTHSALALHPLTANYASFDLDDVAPAAAPAPAAARTFAAGILCWPHH